MQLKKLRHKLDELEKKKKPQFILVCVLIFIIGLFTGVLFGCGIKTYKIFQQISYQKKVRQELEQSLTQRLEKMQLKVKFGND